MYINNVINIASLYRDDIEIDFNDQLLSPRRSARAATPVGSTSLYRNMFVTICVPKYKPKDFKKISSVYMGLLYEGVPGEVDVKILGLQRKTLEQEYTRALHGCPRRLMKQ